MIFSLQTANSISTFQTPPAAAPFRTLADDIANEIGGTVLHIDTIAAKYDLDRDTLETIFEDNHIRQCDQCDVWRVEGFENLDRCPTCEGW